MQGATDQAAVSDSDSEEAQSPLQPAQSAEVSQEWLNQQPPSPDDERGASGGAAAASGQIKAQIELDAPAKRHKERKRPPSGDGLPVEVRTTCGRNHDWL